MVVFAALWHPQGRRLVEQAREWSQKRHTRLAVFSVDWYAEQAKRHLSKLDGGLEVLYAGPKYRSSSEDWQVKLPGQAFLLGSDGKLVEAARPGELPQGKVGH